MPCTSLSKGLFEKRGDRERTILNEADRPMLHHAGSDMRVDERSEYLLPASSEGDLCSCDIEAG